MVDPLTSLLRSFHFATFVPVGSYRDSLRSVATAPVALSRRALHLPLPLRPAVLIHRTVRRGVPKHVGLAPCDR